MKKIHIIITVLALSIFTSCQRVENEDGIKDSSTVEDSSDNRNSDWTKNPEKIQTELSSGVIVNADVKVPENIKLENMPVYFATLQEVSFEKFRELFIKNNEEIKNKIEQASEDKIGNNIYKYYQMQDESTITYTGGVFLQYTSARYQNVQVDFEIEDSTQDRFHQDFDFETRESANQEIRNIFKELDITVSEEYQCSSVDYQWLQEKNQEQEIEYADIPDVKKQSNTEETLWNEDLNCYLFQYFGEVNQVPMTDKIREEKDTLIPATQIYVVYSKNGVEQMGISNCFELKEKESESSIYNQNEILSRLDEKYNSIILEGDYSVEKLQLEYVPIETDKTDTYKLIPAWRIFVVQELTRQSKDNPSESEVIKIPTEVLFNAIDGKEILTGVGV